MLFFEKKIFFNKKQCYKPGRSGAGCSRPQSSLHQNGRTYSTVFYNINEIFSKNNIVIYGMRNLYLARIQKIPTFQILNSLYCVPTCNVEHIE